MEELLWKSESNLSSSYLGRLMSTVLGARPRELDAAYSRLSCSPQKSSGFMLDGSLCSLQKYVRDTVERKEPLDQILVPMIENASRNSKNFKLVLRLLNWLFQDEGLFLSLSSDLKEIIIRKEDHYIALGWCTLIRGLVDQELDTNQSSDIGKHGKLPDFLKILSSSIPRLSSIVCKRSAMDNGFELPTRLSVAAADCILVLTEALSECKHISGVPRTKMSNGNPTLTTRQVTLLPASRDKVEGDFVYGSHQGLEDMEMELLLWNHLDELIVLVQKLQAWNKKSRPLHAKGLGQVLKWLQDLRGPCNALQDGSGGRPQKTALLLLSSCWKHYGKLMRLEDHKFSQHHKEMLDQYISAIQFYTQQDEVEEHSGRSVGSIETKKFFLNCTSLLWGRLNSNQFELAMSECGHQISNLLFSQLQCMDDGVTEVAAGILRTIIFKSNFPLLGCCPEKHQLESLLPSMLNLLDERDSIARAVVLFIAEFCAIDPDGQCLIEIFKRLDVGNSFQRRNAIDVISELLIICSDSGNNLSPSLRQDIAGHLLKRLGDEELANRVLTSNLFTQLDPSFVLPPLVRLVYSLDGRVRSSASDAIDAVLKCHNQKLDVIIILLDDLRNLSQSPDLLKSQEQGEEHVSSDFMTSQLGSKMDIDRVLKLIPKWSETVQDWINLIEPLIDKVFVEPTNAVLIRFLSYISEQLADAGDVVFHRVLVHMQGQKEMNECLFSKWRDRSFTENDSIELSNLLFDRLCPLLIVRLLPLRVFDDLNSSKLYGQLHSAVHGKSDYWVKNHDCVAALLMNRAFHLFEFEDVRKLAAELCGRLHPQVVLPIIGSQLDQAMHVRDILKMKACLFAVCTSLVVKGKESALHPIMIKIRKLLETALLWPSLDSDDVSKAQHGCIDCLAFMICAELQASESSDNSTQSKIIIVQEESECPGDAASIIPVLTYVIQNLTCQSIAPPLKKSENKMCYRNSYSNEKSLNAKLAIYEGPAMASLPLPFRICMANVLISACQKISSSSGKLLYAQRTLPPLIHFVEVTTDSDVKAAILQVLFTTVYHLKTTVLPYSSDMLGVSIKSLRKGSEKERIAGAKLMASLMASEDLIVESISASLLEAKTTLASISLMDSSSELRELCEKLLACITSPIDDAILCPS